MSGTRPVTLKPGDAILWVPAPDEKHLGPSPLRVAEDNEALMFTYAPMPWHEMTMLTKDDQRRRGYTRIEAEMVLNGELPFAFPGRIYKWFDGETRERLPDPEAT